LQNQNNVLPLIQQNDKDMTTEMKATELRKKMITDFGFDHVGFVSSSTDFGDSFYLTTNTGLKIRISDHDATNSVRVEKEIMFKNSDTLERMIYTIEQIAFPERFGFRLCVAGEKPTHIKNGKPMVISRIS